MARKTASPERYAQLNGGKPATFVNYSMSDAQKKQYKKWLSEQTEATLFDLIGKAIEAGYAISIKHDDYNECEGAFMTTNREDNPNKPLILTGRGRSVITAAANVLYKHFVLFEGSWPEATARKTETDED